MAGKLVSPTRYKASIPQPKHAVLRQKKQTFSEKMKIPLQADEEDAAALVDVSNAPLKPNGSAIHLPKSASSPQLPVEAHTRREHTEKVISRDISEVVLHQAKVAHAVETTNPIDESIEEASRPKFDRRKSSFPKFGSRLTISRFATASSSECSESNGDLNEAKANSSDVGKKKTTEKQKARSFTNLRRKSWILSKSSKSSKSKTPERTPARTPERISSPTDVDVSNQPDEKPKPKPQSETPKMSVAEDAVDKDGTTVVPESSTPETQERGRDDLSTLPVPGRDDTPSRASEASSTSSGNPDLDKKEIQKPPPLKRKGTVLQKARRPLSVILPKSKSEINIPKSPSLHSIHIIRHSASSERLSSTVVSRDSSSSIPPIPHNTSLEKLRSAGSELFRRRDELYSVFRSLEGDLQKLQNKPCTLKAGVIRSSLLPFLHRYANHPSNNTLRPEELDRRVAVLNKWWVALLEMLHGRNGQSISGVDRPVVLDAAAGVMGRPEWRLAMSSASMLRSGSHSVPRSQSATSLESEGSDFLAESIYHNVRNMFMQNLLSQMAFAVEKMCMRNAPASLVTFCGKAAAYAFYFCPGVAHILIRLWAIPVETLRRVLAEAGIGRGTELDDSAEDLSLNFPPSVRRLAVRSVVGIIRSLRRQEPLPLGAGNIPWYGPWVRRWSGAETDLFYVFTKHFNLLLSDYLPIYADKRMRMRAPGVLFVESQMLTVFDATIRRIGGQPPVDTPTGPQAITFDDLLEGTDASATALPLPPANIVRSMAENRLIMLLRDYLVVEGNANLDASRRWFAEDFADLLKATAKRTPMYNHNACFTLADFMEEALFILVRFHQATHYETNLVDWPFWLSVLKKMTDSEDTVTQVRLYAFLYSLWNTINEDEGRRRDLCLGWLLDKELFERQFNHWCPMVRAYFQRLLCWRLARYDDEGTELDTEILETLHARLKGIMSNYLFLEEQATSKSVMPPSTVPCTPAPGRRFIILRNDTNPISFGLLSLDKIIPPSSLSHSTAYRNHASLRMLSDYEAKLAAGEANHAPSNSGRKRWSVLRSIVPFASPSPQSRNTDFDDSPPASRTNSLPHDRVQANGTSTTATPENSEVVVPRHQTFSFKFALEWIDRAPTAGRPRKLYAPRLPPAAQGLIQSKHPHWYDVEPQAPASAASRTSIYSGRALAEWALVILECQSFFERRKNEGVPGNKYVETPTLGVETFRR